MANTTVIVTFLIFLSTFVIIGLSSAMRAKKTTEDYLIASRNVHPFLTSLSAAATNNSGYMFIGLIGFTYAVGISAIWVQIGWVVGDYFAWQWIYKKLRTKTEDNNVSTIPSFLGTSKSGKSKAVIVVAGIVTLIFLSAYAGAQLKAGGKALHVLFHWDYSTGAIIGAVMVVAYCIAGGIRASIWTDVAQAFVMIIAMALLLTMAFITVGLPGDLYIQLHAINPDLVKVFPAELPGLFVIGWVFAGFGVIGQPHIQIRTMALNSPKNIKKAGIIYFSWYIPFSVATLLVGLYAKVMISAENFDPELALPFMSMELLPDIFVGLILAGLFAATMSTADSQVLSCSAALTQDIMPGLNKSRVITKIGTFFITAAALLFATFDQFEIFNFIPESISNSVFKLVIINWSALGAGLGPLMIIRTFTKNLNQIISIAMIIVGIATVFVWNMVLGWSDYVYEIMPGMIAGFLTYFIGKVIESIFKKSPVN